jgi:hypothetical protein
MGCIVAGSRIGRDNDSSSSVAGSPAVARTAQQTTNAQAHPRRIVVRESNPAKWQRIDNIEPYSEVSGITAQFGLQACVRL